MNKLTKLRIITGVIVLIAFGVGTLWLLVPSPADADTGQFYSPFGTPTTLVDLMFAIGGGVLFLLAFRNFKKELKPAYRLIAAAQLSVGALTMFFPYIEYYNLWDNVWMNMSSYLAYLFGSILMYFGMRSFLKILGMRSKITSLWVMLPLTIAVSVVHALLPHADVWTTLSEHKYDLFEIAVIIPVLYYAAAAYIAFKIRHKIGNEYRKAFSWLAGGLGLQMVSAITILVLDMIGYDNWYFNTRTYELPTILADLLILTAAYNFNTIGLPYLARSSWIRRLFGHGNQSPVTSIDIITYTAGMVSNPNGIDPALDKVRVLTAQMQPDQALTESNQQVLRNVYLEIEQYLVTAEPLRSFTREQLRGDVVKHFSLDTNTAITFWPSVSG